MRLLEFMEPTGEPMLSRSKMPTRKAGQVSRLVHHHRYPRRRCRPRWWSLLYLLQIPARVVNHLHPAREAEKGWQKLCQPFSLEAI
jgi:hypothetical protein